MRTGGWGARRLAQRVQLLAPPLVRRAELLEPIAQPLNLGGELLGLVLGAVGLRVRAFLGVPAPGEGGGVRVGVVVVWWW